MKRIRTPLQQCPICKAYHPLEAQRCTECGAVLRGIPVPGDVELPTVQAPSLRANRTARIEAPPASNWEAGESDLYAGLMPTSPLSVIVIGIVLVGLLIVVLLLAANRFGLSGGAAPVPAATTAIAAALNDSAEAFVTSTPPPSPTAFLEFATPTPTVIDLTGGTPANPALVVVTATPLTVLVSTPIGETPTPDSTLTRLAPPPTNTRVLLVPTLPFATITPVPPTITPTPTRGPCLQKAKAGDTLFGLAARCGHQDLAIIAEILRRNNMGSAAELQIGQEVDIPWPTPKGGEGGSGGGTGEQPITGGGPSNEPTLPPGVMWYTVKKGETALSIVFDRGITMRILRDLNPQITFEACDYSLQSGGPACSVMVFEGQRLRVPAPTPTPTIPPTASGSETPTPTATPTFNAPFAQSPSDNMLFDRFDLPTLRWVGTGALALDEVYLLTVENRTANLTYNITTRELAFQLPADWQPSDGRRHVFAWTVTVAKVRNGNTVFPTQYSTGTRTFTWQSR